MGSAQGWVYRIFTMKPVHLFVPTFRTDEVLEEIRICLDKGWTGLGFKTLEFEQAWRRYTGLPHAHFVNSATAGLHLAVKLLKEKHRWAEGDEIITTPFTFVSTNHAILYEGLQPLFADVDEYLCLDPESVQRRLSPRTRAVCFVGVGGNAGRYEALRALCRDRGLPLILDAAHMAGTWMGTGEDQHHAGHDADVTVFSFHAVKNLPTADAGMICFADEELDREVRKWTWMGINKDTYARTYEATTDRWRYHVDCLGFNYHGNSIMAAMGLVGLRYLDEDNACRRQLAQWYDEALGEIAGVARVPMAPGCLPSRHLYQVLVDRRDELVRLLNQQDVYAGVHYLDNTAYPMYQAAHGTCPRASAAGQRVISLPLHLHMDRSEVAYVSECLGRILPSTRIAPRARRAAPTKSTVKR